MLLIVLCAVDVYASEDAVAGEDAVADEEAVAGEDAVAGEEAVESEDAGAGEEAVESEDAVAGEDVTFTDKDVKFIHEGTEEGTLKLRFYNDTPNVPYMGIREYAEHFMKSPMELGDNGDGTVTLKNDLGGELLCNADAGTIFSADWVKVVTPPMPLENEAISLKDMPCGFARITEISYEGEPDPVTFDFSKYDVQIYADGQDVYLPVSMLAEMMTDIATNFLSYNGETLQMYRIALNDSSLPPGYLSDTLTSQLGGEKRPEDVAKQSYADICFTYDYLYGQTGKSKLGDAVAEKGLDQALTELGEEGQSLKAGLLSQDLSQYMSAQLRLIFVYMSDGHTSPYDVTSLMLEPAFSSNQNAYEALVQEYYDDFFESKVMIVQTVNTAIPPQRKLVWGDENYIESGSTAIIRLDTFMPDEKAWENYYAGDGDFPEDCLGKVAAGLQRASENPEIENVILDLSCNGGGSSDVLVAVLGLTTGQNQLYGFNQLTGQKMIVTYETDTNFDGVFDEKDKDAGYDFNYGVLTTRYAFSCGNLFPIIMREGGAVVIGEPTSGGSCSIQFASDIEGIRYLISSKQWQLTDSTGKDVEGGCTVDLPIEPENADEMAFLVSHFGVENGFPVYTGYFDAEKLDALMNSQFGEAAGEAEAAEAA